MSPLAGKVAPSEMLVDLARLEKAEFANTFYRGIHTQASPEQKAKLQKLSPDSVKEAELCRTSSRQIDQDSPGNNAPIGGLRVVAKSGWFATRYPQAVRISTSFILRVSKGATSECDRY